MYFCFFWKGLQGGKIGMSKGCSLLVYGNLVIRLGSHWTKNGTSGIVEGSLFHDATSPETLLGCPRK